MMKTKRGKLKAIAAGIVAFVGIGASAIGADQEIWMIDVDAWGSGSSGGPFEVRPFDIPSVQGLGQWGAGGTNFITFCVEKTEFLTNGGKYDVVLNTEARYNGGGSGSSDPLDEKTAFLYTAFIKGTLDDKLDAAYGVGTWDYEQEPDGAALQDAIWYLEGEIGSVSGLAADIVDLADDAVAFGGEWFGKGIGNVRVLNMYGNGHRGEFDYRKQDLLVLIPLPAPILLGIAGLAGVGVFSSRRRKNLGV